MRVISLVSRMYLGRDPSESRLRLDCARLLNHAHNMLSRSGVTHTYASLPLANNLTSCRRTIEVWPRNSSAGECRRDRRVRLVAHCTCSTPRVRPLPSAYTLGSCRGDGFGMVALRIVLLWVFCSTAACRYALRSARTHWCCGSFARGECSGMPSWCFVPWGGSARLSGPPLFVLLVWVLVPCSGSELTERCLNEYRLDGEHAPALDAERSLLCSPSSAIWQLPSALGGLGLGQR